MEWLRSPHLPAFVLAAILTFGVGAWLTGDWIVWGGVALAIVCLPLLLLAFAAWVGRSATKAIASWIEASPDRSAAPDSDGDADVTASRPQPLKGDEKIAKAQLQRRLKNAVQTIRDSRLGEKRGRSALYDLPWVMVIGHAAAGKSSMIKRAGLSFPLGDEYGQAVAGAGGTRDCDWYFTSQGILLDTAGRYSGDGAADNVQWLSFLAMLRRHRPHAPINGLIVAASLGELRSQAEDKTQPDAVERHAVDLRQRIQELTRRLGVTVPVYVVFTKADLIGGFREFFASMDDDEFNQVWGATLPFDDDDKADPCRLFSEHFDILDASLRGHARGLLLKKYVDVKSSYLAIPAEFASLKPILARFIQSLFGDNAFHVRPFFRGFYFTSAEQFGFTTPTVFERVASRFALAPAHHAVSFPELSVASASAAAEEIDNGRAFFLQDLFRKVIFADDKMVRRASTPRQRRVWMVQMSAIALATGLMIAWLTAAYLSNTALIRSVEADFAEVKRLQEGRIDLMSRLDALLVLQNRLEQLLAYREHRPFRYWGVYAGDTLLTGVRREYFHGMRAVMVDPVSRRMHAYLGDVVAGRGTPVTNASTSASVARSPYQPVSSTDTEAAYNALKGYLMLADARRAEPAHLATQLSLFWREWLDEHRGTMSREAMAERAERLLSLHVTLAGEPGWPSIQPRVALVDDTRRVLAQAMQGTPARDRVYAEIVSRASARYPAVTVRGIVGDSPDTVLTGSYAVPGAYTAAAWDNYIRQAIDDAAHKALDTSDWVLRKAQKDDLTLSGSPEHVRKELKSLYASRYIDQWQRFLAGAGIAELPDFGRTVAAMERLGDIDQSPLRKLLERARAETAWDSASNAALATPRGGADPSKATAAAPAGAVPAIEARGTDGPVTRAFAGLARMVDATDGAEAPLRNYLAALGRLRTRLHVIENEGELGPGARRLVEATLQAKGSELAEALLVTDENMLVGLGEAQRRALRPLLLRPLTQTFASLVPHAEKELNRIWEAQVYKPFLRDLATKYPFDQNGRVEASEKEVAVLFGPDGAIGRFAADVLGPLVERRGDVLSPRQWGDRRITLSPTLLTDFAQWVAPLGTRAAGPQSVFQLMPEQAVGGIREYTVMIGGQTLRYRDEPPQWSNFAWGGSSTLPSVLIEATANDGRLLRVAEFQGKGALGELIRSAKTLRIDDDTHLLSWSKDGITIAVRLRIVTSAPMDDGAPDHGLHAVQLPATIAGDA